MALNPAYEYNPYSPTFGAPPAAYIHRDFEENKILNDFCSPLGTIKSYMILGARGVGKTVLMHEMANRFETFPDWVVVRMNPNVDMMAALVKKLSGHKKVMSLIKSVGINLSFFNIDLKISDSSIKDEEDAVTEILKALEKDSKRLLIIVDEATNTDYMRIFASAYQNLIGQRLPVYLLMTGLYENINSLKNEKNLTFLYRMPRIILPPLKTAAIADNYQDVFQTSNDIALKMAACTKGYSYAFQLLGKLTWDKGGNYTKVLDEYKSDLNEMVYGKIWDEMSEKDREFVYAITLSQHGEVKELRKILDWKTNELSPYRDRLLKKGVIDSPGYGLLQTSLPFFKSFVKTHYDITISTEDLPEDL